MERKQGMAREGKGGVLPHVWLAKREGKVMFTVKMVAGV